MAFNVLFSEECAESFSEIADQDVSFVIKKSENLEAFPRIPHIKMISSFSKVYALRAGEYKILFEVVEKDIIIKKIYQ